MFASKRNIIHQYIKLARTFARQMSLLLKLRYSRVSKVDASDISRGIDEQVSCMRMVGLNKTMYA